VLLERLLCGYPDLLDVPMSLGLNDQRLRRQDEGAREFQRVLKADPLNAKVHLDLGLSLCQLRTQANRTKNNFADPSLRSG